MFSTGQLITGMIIIGAIYCLALYRSSVISIKEGFNVIKPGYICANAYYSGTNNKKSPLVPGFISDFFDATGSRQLPPQTCYDKCAATTGCTTFSTRMGDYGGCTLCNSSANSSTFSNKGGDNAYNTYSIGPPIGYCHEDPNNKGYYLAKTTDTTGWGSGDSCYTPLASAGESKGSSGSIGAVAYGSAAGAGGCIGGGGISECKAACKGVGLNCGILATNYSCVDSGVTCPKGFGPVDPVGHKYDTSTCGTDCIVPSADNDLTLSKYCGCKCGLGQGQVEGQKRCLPTNSNAGQGRVPNTSMKGYTAAMNCGTCNNRLTETDCAQDQVNCYWGVPTNIPNSTACTYSKDPNLAGGLFTCGSDKCCAANPKCSSLEDNDGIACPTGQHMSDPNKVCTSVGGSGRVYCSAYQCCVDNLTCNSYSDNCKSAGKILKGGDIICDDTGCTIDTCCEPVGTCSPTACQIGVSEPIIGAICAGNPCTKAECCRPNSTCSTKFQCGQGYTYDTTKTGRTCQGYECRQSDCCKLNENCVNYLSNNSCPPDEEPKSNPSTDPCQSTECTPLECCNINPTCKGYICSPSFYEDSKLVSDPNNRHCATEVCTDNDCCITSSSGKLPKIQTFPLY